MRPAYFTLADPTLPHQVRFVTSKDQVHVTCNCRLVYIGLANGDLDLARELYNDPRNHVGPFTQEDEAKW